MRFYALELSNFILMSAWLHWHTLPCCVTNFGMAASTSAAAGFDSRTSNILFTWTYITVLSTELRHFS